MIETIVIRLNSIMVIKREIQKKMLASFNNPIPERGGIIGGRDGIIMHFEEDKSNLKKNIYQYIPNVIYLNQVLEKWAKKNIQFYGIIHSHPKSQAMLSEGDKIYIYNILMCVRNYCDELYFPIALGGDVIVPYKAYILNQKLRVISDSISLI